MNRMKSALAIGCATMMATSASAQDAIMALNPTTMIGYAGTTAGNAYKPRDFGPRLAARTRPNVSRARVTPAQVIARTSYRPDPAVRNRVYARSVAMMQRAGAADVTKYRQILVSGTMRNEVAGILGRYGMSPNNVVDTTAIYLAAAWLASHGNNGAPSAAQMKGLRVQLANAYASMPELLASTNATKQELAEANMLQATLSSAIAEQAERNPRLAPKLRAVVAGWVKDSYQIDLTRMNLTAQGLR